MDSTRPFETLSVVIPAYNEAGRLPRFLAGLREHFALDPCPGGCEVIVVDDGSRDGTGDVVRGLARGWPELELIRHRRNRGKGAALRTGMAAATGDAILLVDADGAAATSEAMKLAGPLSDGIDVVVGVRSGRRLSRAAWRSPRRALGGMAFAWYVRRCLDLPVSDTQCGCKLLRRTVARTVLPLCREEGYLFDLEILAQAYRLGFSMAEVPIAWADVPGSKVRLLQDALRMLHGLGRVRRSSRRGPTPTPDFPGAPASRDRGAPGGDGGRQLVLAEQALAHNDARGVDVESVLIGVRDLVPCGVCDQMTNSGVTIGPAGQGHGRSGPRGTSIGGPPARVESAVSVRPAEAHRDPVPS